MYEELNEVYDITVCPSLMCNLRCKYCGLDKGSITAEYEKEIIKSFEDENYYFNFITNTIPNRNQIERFDFWGGEVSLYLDRAIPLCKRLIEYYPNLQTFFFSTNFTNTKTLDQIKLLLDLFKSFKDRRFNLDMQISLDGPEEITDFGRGEGTTKKILENFNTFINEKGFLENSTNIQISLSISATLSSKLLYKFNDKEYMLNWYRFFEDSIYSKYMKLCKTDYRFDSNQPVIPRFETPYNWTPSDGISLLEICRTCRELEKSLPDYGLMIYETITPYHSYLSQDRVMIYPTYNYHYSFCSPTFRKLLFLPNNKLSGCSCFADVNHISFTPNMKNIGKKTPLLFNNKEEVCKFIHDLIYNTYYFGKNGNPYLYSNVCLVQNLAKAGLIDTDLINEDKALRALYIILNNTNIHCLKNTMDIAKTYMANGIGEYMFFLNGAYKYFYKFADGRLLNDVYDQL